MAGKTRVRVTWCALAVSAVAAFLTPLPLVALLNDDEPETNAPAERFTLEYSGKSVDVMLGEPFVVEIEGRRVNMKLTAKRYRVLEMGGVSFHYPRDFKFTEKKSKLSHSITLEGVDSLVQLSKYQSNDAIGLVNTMTAATSESLKGKQYAVKESDRTLTLGKHTFKGKRLVCRLAGQTIHQEYLALDTPTGVLILMLQDSATGKKKASAQFAELTQMLKETFTVKE